MAYRADTFTGGDISSSANDSQALQVDKIQGVTISTSGITTGQILKYNGTQIEPATDSAPADIQRDGNITEIDNLDSPYSVITGDDYILVDTNTAAVTVTLPNPATWTGPKITVKDSGGAAVSTKKITINPNGAETIDGLSSATISARYGSKTFITNGTNWFIL